MPHNVTLVCPSPDSLRIRYRKKESVFEKRWNFTGAHQTFSFDVHNIFIYLKHQIITPKIDTDISITPKAALQIKPYDTHKDEKYMLKAT